MIQNRSLHVTMVTVLTSIALSAENQMITDTKKAINTIRSNVIKQAQEDQKTIRGTWCLDALMGAAKFLKLHDKATISNAKVAFPFFKVRGADACLSTIGSTQEDIDYINSVFTEFYGSGERTKYRLYTILHRHMMVALGLPTTKTLDQFKHMIEKTDHNGFPKSLNKRQFEIYCRCVARGLYAVYWFGHGYN